MQGESKVVAISFLTSSPLLLSASYCPLTFSLSSFERFLLAIQDRGIAMLEGEKPYRLLKPIVSASSTRGTPDEGRCIEERKRGIVETRFSSLSDGSSSGAQMKRKHEDVAASHRRRSPNVTRTTTTSSPLKRYKRPRICPDYRRVK